MNSVHETTGSATWRRQHRDGPEGGALRQALARTTDFLIGRSTFPAVMARHLLGLTTRGDASLSEHLIRERRRRTRMDGSVDGSLLDTVEVATELLDLDCPIDHAAVVRTLGFILSRQNAPGHFGEGCTPVSHAAGECRHHVVGFFSPGNRDVDLVPVQVGLVKITDEEAARFAISCRALRCVLRAGEDRRPSVRSHVESLLEFDSLWTQSAKRWTLDHVFFAVGALAAAPLQYRSAVDARLDSVLSLQDADGVWPGASQLHVLDALMGYSAVRAQEAARRGASALLSLQREDGSFITSPDERGALIALRALRLATI